MESSTASQEPKPRPSRVSALGVPPSNGSSTTDHKTSRMSLLPYASVSFLVSGVGLNGLLCLQSLHIQTPGKPVSAEASTAALEWPKMDGAESWAHWRLEGPSKKEGRRLIQTLPQLPCS